MRAALTVAMLSASAACTLDHTIGMVNTGGAGGSGPGPCGAGGGGGGGGVPASPIEECQVDGGQACTSPDEHCVEATYDLCQGGPCPGWCMPTQVSAAAVCAGGTNLGCPTGMYCTIDPYLECEPELICCEGVCFGVNLAPAGVAVGSCAPQGCTAPEHCVSDPAAACAYDGGTECAGVCVPAAQASAVACGPYPDFHCATGLRCLKNPNHPCTLPFDCPGLCVPE